MLNCAPSNKPTALELQRAMLNWQQQQQQQPQNQSMWFHGLQLPLGQNFAAAYSASQRYPILEEDHKSAVTVSQDTLPNISATGDAMKKRMIDAKIDSSDNHKKKKIDPDEIHALEMPELESNSNLKKEASESATPKSTDFIHVRARRGQATDSHSLAERVRREKISERMKYLQDLVPGCSNITGKASVLDEIINYVQSLQKQVEFLSMKLAAVNPLIECNVQSFMGKEVIKSSCSTSISKEMSMELLNSSYSLVNSLQTARIPSNSAHGGITLNLAELNVLHKTTSVPVSVPVAFSEPYFDVCGSSAWDYNTQEVYKMDCAQEME